ncbi:hypothetical protein EDD86DRAFT_207535 [Gorgonomyces haynaldii]|nr:hypothetical protein EDD86DRAFT_207535 [Gorgonomyces haynaldii]
MEPAAGSSGRAAHETSSHLLDGCHRTGVLPLAMQFVDSLTTTLVIILCFYGLAVCLQLTVMGLTALYWSILPQRFRISAAASSFLIFVGFATCVMHLLTINDRNTCTIGREFAYAFFYTGFFVYDAYQFVKIQAITGSGKFSNAVLYVLLFARLASYAFNVAIIQGIPSNVNALGAGSCTTKFPLTLYVYQEHLFSIIFEFALALKLILYLRSTSSKDIPLPELLRRVVDFEMISFFIYFVVECVYTIAFSIMDSHWTSLLNTFYLNVPILLFLINTIMFTSKTHLEARVRRSNMKSGYSRNTSDHTAPQSAQVLTA